MASSTAWPSFLPNFVVETVAVSIFFSSARVATTLKNLPPQHVDILVARHKEPVRLCQRKKSIAPTTFSDRCQRRRYRSSHNINTIVARPTGRNNNHYPVREEQYRTITQRSSPRKSANRQDVLSFFLFFFLFFRFLKIWPTKTNDGTVHPRRPKWTFSIVSFPHRRQRRWPMADAVFGRYCCCCRVGNVTDLCWAYHQCSVPL